MLSSGAALGPVLAHDHLMDMPGSQGPDHSIPSCSPTHPQLPGSWAHGLWGASIGRGRHFVIAACVVLSPHPQCTSLCLLSPEQNVNQHLKAKGIEYLSYP